MLLKNIIYQIVKNRRRDWITQKVWDTCCVAGWSIQVQRVVFYYINTRPSIRRVAIVTARCSYLLHISQICGTIFSASRILCEEYKVKHAHNPVHYSSMNVPFHNQYVGHFRRLFSWVGRDADTFATWVSTHIWNILKQWGGIAQSVYCLGYRPEYRGSISYRAGFFSSPWRSTRLWVSPSLLPRRFFPRGKRSWSVKLTTHLHPVPRLRTYASIPPVLIQ
jgi:hypothetical protein